MKTSLLMLLMVSISALSAGATNEPVTLVKKISEHFKRTDSSEVKEAEFKIEFLENQNKVVVALNGDFDQYSSVSVTNNRGSEYCFTFVESGEHLIEFDVAGLEAGSYFVMLNTGNEIRMIRFRKD